MIEINLFKNSRFTRTLAPGETLFSEGEQGEQMFAVLDGEVAVSVRDTVIETVQAGGIVGEMALVDTAPRSATVRATMPATVAVVDSEHFTFMVQEHPTFALMVMSVMAERLRRQTTQLAGE